MSEYDALTSTPACCATLWAVGICTCLPPDEPTPALLFVKFLVDSGRITDWPPEPHQSAPEGRQTPPLYGVGFWLSWVVTGAVWVGLFWVTWGRT